MAIDQLHQALALLQDELAYGGHAPTSLRRAAIQHTRRAWLLLTGSQDHHIADGPPS